MNARPQMYVIAKIHDHGHPKFLRIDGTVCGWTNKFPTPFTKLTAQEIARGLSLYEAVKINIIYDGDNKQVSFKVGKKQELSGSVANA